MHEPVLFAKKEEEEEESKQQQQQQREKEEKRREESRRKETRREGGGMDPNGCSSHSEALACHGPTFHLLIAACFLFVVIILLFLSTCCLRRGRIPPSPGLNPKILASIPVLVRDRGSGECAICLNDVEAGEELRVLPRCNHEFHALCIDAWFGSGATCPLCRAVVEMPDSAGATACILRKWKSIMDAIAQRGQGLEAEPDLEMGEGAETSVPPLRLPSSSS